MKGGGVLEMSEVLWFSPKGRKLEGSGIVPDEAVVPTVDDLQQKRDPVVAEAERVLRQLAVAERQSSRP
jgi:C-terminal processing protease CtpA/Prc